MLLNEAKWFGQILSKMSNNDLGNVLDLGSGSFIQRKIRQPWIDKYIFNPLSKRGVEVIHKDYELDVESEDLDKKIKKLGNFKTFFICSLLEHVKNYHKASKNIASIVPVGGYLFVSAPRNFPYHPDPIDNMFRPDLFELKALFLNFKTIAMKEIGEKRKLTFNKQSFLWLNKTFLQNCLILKKE